MEDLLKDLITSILSGGSQSVIAVLLLFLAFLIYDHTRLINENAKREDKLNQIIEEYQKGTITLSEALNGIKVALAEIKGHLW